MTSSFDPIVDTTSLLKVTDHMRLHSADYITPISEVLSDDEGRLVGTGTFVKLNGMPYIMTNEHVARVRLNNSVAHFVGDDDRGVCRIINPFYCLTEPTDIAVSLVYDEVWKIICKDLVPSRRMCTTFEPVPGEILFIHGYPGRHSHFSAIASGLLTRTLPYGTMAVPLPNCPDKYDPDMHFAISYPMNMKLTDCDGNPKELPPPPGLSGSFVWDTGFVRCAKKSIPWFPQRSKPCGVIYAWDMDHQCLIGTKMEYVRTFLLQALRMESAYFHWQNRGQPANDPLTDWINAENEIQEL